MPYPKFVRHLSSLMLKTLQGVSWPVSRSMAAAVVLAPMVAMAAYPDRPVRLIVPFPAGGGTDIVARVVGPYLSAELKQPVVFDNRAGAGTVIGTDLAAKATPDGYTLLFTSSAFTANSSLMKKLPYDPLKSFAPIGGAALHPFVLVGHPSLPAKNFNELMAYAKANPGKLSYASVGVGSSQHLGMELLKRQAGIDLVHVAYTGSAPATTAIVGGQVQLMFNGVSPTLQLIRGDKLKVFAVDSQKRVPLLPEVPTVSESGVQGFKITTWSGLLAPVGLPAEAYARLTAAWAKVMSLPQVQTALAERGLIPNPLSPSEFGTMLQEDRDDWARLVKEAGVQPE